MKKLLAKITVWLLKKNRLEQEDKALVLTALLDNIGILPLYQTITFDMDGTIKINGKKLEPQEAITLQQGAKVMRDLWTRKVIRNQMKYEALMLGVLGNTTDQIVFAKAVNYILLLEEELLDKIDAN